jgi:alpha-N-arabinofuranosidase
VLAVFAGYVLKRDYLKAGPMLKPFVDDALDEIEYVIGDTSTKWGAQRAKDGHPAPFPLHYIEIGNEDGFDVSMSYTGRFQQFAEAIRAKYPQLKLISTVGGNDYLGKRYAVPKMADVIDEHFYRNAAEMEGDAAHYDGYDRKGPKVFVGEWATREGSPTTNLNAALGDAAWMTGMERNSDVVVLASYAPLFVNVNPGGMQWKSDLIGYDALNSYGSPSYYAQKMFSQYLGNKGVPVSGEGIGTVPPPANAGNKNHPAPPAVPALYYVATRGTDSGKVYLKIVNVASSPQAVHIQVKGSKIASAGSATVLTSAKPDDTNSITEPTKVVPVTTKVSDLGNDFTRTLAPYSVNVLELSSR